MKPKISVIIPVYNVEEYLSACLDSIAKQTLKDIEIILVNDGSTDNSGNIANQYAVKYSFILIHKEKNEGTLLARKTGIDIATGKYIVFVDADDYFLLDTAFEILYNEIEKRQTDILHFSCIVGNEKDDPIVRNRMSKYIHKFINEKQKTTEDIIASAFIFETISCVLWGKIFRTEVIKKASEFINPVRMVYCEDTYLFLLISSFAHSYEYMNCEPLYFYRLNENGQSCKDRELTKDEFYKESFVPIANSLDKFLETNNNVYIYQAILLMKIRLMNHLSKKPSV